ncbi:MAG TPA: hypothetical protein VGM84_14220 [Steroidobacteraceae bacterium]|jgi:hypothetical protein
MIAIARARRASTLLVLAATTSVVAAPPPQQILRPPVVPLQIQSLAFPAIRATAVGPTAVRLDWMPLSGADLYRVYRNGTLLQGSDIASTSSATAQLSFTDQSAPTGTPVAYSITALHMTTTCGLPNTPNAGKCASLETLMQTSNTASVVAAPLLPPPGLTASLDPANAALVHLSWPAPPSWQGGFLITRNGVQIGTSATLGANDNLPGPGWYHYQIASTFPGANGTTTVSIQGPAARLHSGPVRVLAFGDSIMWGQGLADPHKFTSLVRDWLSTNLTLPVVMTDLAHSGGIVQISPTPSMPQAIITTIEQAEGSRGGIPNQFSEAPNSFPTISFQGSAMGPSLGDPNQVDLVIADGCINDIGITTILDPRVNDQDLHNLIVAACGAPELAMLSGLHSRYPNAHIVVTSYYKIASNNSDLGLLNKLATGVGLAGSVIAASIGGPAALAAGLPPPDPITAAIVGAIVGNVAADSYRNIAVDHSTLFLNDSSALLRQNVNSVNQFPVGPILSTGPIAAFATPLFQDVNSYAGPQSWLCLVPNVAGAPQDEVFVQRGVVCQHLPPGDTNYNTTTCPLASMGHPNVTGAQQYALAIEGQLQQWLPGWRKAFATTQTAP